MRELLDTGHASRQGLVDLARVKTRRVLSQGDDIVPAGSSGTIVHVYERGQAFEVEFSKEDVVLTALASDLDLA